MDMVDYLAVLFFLVAAVLFVGVSLTFSSLVRPSKFTPEKYIPYECGENPVGSPWVQFNIRFYVFALVFIIFDVEAVFLFPWAVVYQNLGLFAFVEGLIFIAILALGLAYVWVKGDLEWVRTEDRAPHHQTKSIPEAEKEYGEAVRKAPALYIEDRGQRVGGIPLVFVVARPETSEYNTRACAAGGVGRKVFMSWSLCGRGLES